MKKQSKQQQQNKQKKAHKEGKEIPVPILYFFDTRTDLDARAETFLFFSSSPSSPVSGHPEKPFQPRHCYDWLPAGFFGILGKGLLLAFQETMFSFFFLTLTAYRPTPLVGASERFLLPWVLCRHAR